MRLMFESSYIQNSRSFSKIIAKMSSKHSNKLIFEDLAENLLPYINELREVNHGGDGGDDGGDDGGHGHGHSRVFIFQEDNAPCHKAAVANQWKEENCVILLPWPAQSL